jgi:hypothetical protein
MAMTGETNGPANRTETRLRAFLNPRPPIEQRREEARSLLSRPDLSQVVEGLAPGDKERLIDELIQVRSPDRQWFSSILFSHFCEGIPESPRRRHVAFGLVRKRLQCCQKTSWFSLTLCGTREV